MPFAGRHDVNINASEFVDLLDTPMLRAHDLRHNFIRHADG
jgi:hypothetical protein